MSPLLKQLILRFCDDNPAIPPYAYQIHKHRRRMQIFSWLIEHGYCGKAFLDWFRFHHENSILKMIAFVVKRLDKDSEVKPIIAGRDWMI